MASIKENLDDLNTQDVFSLVLFALYRLKNNPQYSTLSELSYIMDRKTLTRFLQYYGGLTITIPTMEELKHVISALFLYEQVNLEHKKLSIAIKSLEISAYDKTQIVKTYDSICKLLKNYDFNRSGK